MSFNFLAIHDAHGELCYFSHYSVYFSEVVVIHANPDLEIRPSCDNVNTFDYYKMGHDSEDLVDAMDFAYVCDFD